MSTPHPDPEGIYVISRGDLMSGIAAADDPVVQWLWSQLALGGTADPLDPSPVHRVALGYPSRAADPLRQADPESATAALRGRATPGPADEAA